MKLTIIIPVYNQQTLVIRALQSIPVRDDIEIIVIDDGSTDNTFNNVLKYRDKSKQNIVLLYNETNKGVSHTVNKGLSYASGEYIVLLGSDDYFYTDELLKFMELLNGYDLVYFDLRVNDGNILHLDNLSKNGLCGSVKAMRKDFIKGIKNDENIKSGEDYYFNKELQKRNPKELFSNLVVKHYNFPREGSLYDLKKKGLIK